MRNKLFLILLFLETSFQQPCFDLSLDSTTCKSCSYNYFISTIDWNFSSFSTSNCTPKQNYYEAKVYINSSSDSDCTQVNQCDGSLSFPYNDLFSSFENIMATSLPYMNSTFHVYLLGFESHGLYTSKIANGFFMFKRVSINLIIETLFCSDLNVIGCHVSGSLAEILLKRNDILFFISNALTFKNIRFNGIDMLAYNRTTDITFKENNKNIAFCQEADLNSINVDSLKSICFLSTTAFFLSSSYGLFNFEILYDNPLFITPNIQIQNCEFVYLNFLQKSSYFMQSIMNVLQGSPVTIYIESTKFHKFLSFKGILNLNQNSDPFYFYVSIPKLIKYLNPGLFNITINNVSILDYNNFHLSLNNSNSIDFLSIFNIHNNQTSNLYSNFPSLNILIWNSNFSQLSQINQSGVEFFFIRISGFKNGSNFTSFNLEFSNNYLIYFVHVWDFVNVHIMSSKFMNNTDFSFFYSRNPVIFSNNTLQNITAYCYAMMYLNNSEIKILYNNFIDFFFPQITLIKEVKFTSITSNLISLNNVPQTSNSITFAFLVFQNMTVEYLIHIDLSLNFVFFSNILLSVNNYYYKANNTLISVQVVLNIFYFAFSEVKDDISHGPLTLIVFASNLTVYKNLNIQTGDLLLALFVENYTNYTTVIMENLDIETGDFHYIYDNNPMDALFNLQSGRLTDSIFKGITYNQFNNPTIFNIHNCQLFLFSNVTFDYENESDGATYNLIYFDYSSTAFINALLNFTNVRLYNVAFSAISLTNVYVNNCSFSYPSLPQTTTARTVLGLVMSSKGYFAMINSNFSNMDYTFITSYIDRLTNFLVVNCNFNFTSGINVAFLNSDSNFIPNNLLNGRSSDFFSNYYKYCNSKVGQSTSTFNSSLSYEFCLNYSINNSTVFMIYTVPAFNMTEWSFLFLNNFGFINSNFYYGDLKSPQNNDLFHLNTNYKTNVLARNCRFEQRTLSLGGGFMQFAGGYQAVFINCSFQNFASPYGGKLFQLTMGNMTIINSTFKNINSLSDGAVISIQSCSLTLFNCSFQNISSDSQGSVVYAIQSSTNISFCTMNGSTALLKGAHFFAEGGTLSVLRSNFMFGYSSYGGSLYLSHLSFVLISYSSFQNCSSQKGGIYIDGVSLITYEFDNISFTGNSGDDGALIYAKDANINLNGCVIEMNDATISYVFFASSFFPYQLNILNLNMSDNGAKTYFFFIENSKFLLTSAIFSDNLFDKYFFDILNSANFSLFNSVFQYNSESISDQPQNSRILLSIDSSFGFLINISINASYYTTCLSLSSSIWNTLYSDFIQCQVGVIISKNSSMSLNFSNVIENVGDIGAGLVLKDSKLNCFSTSFKNNKANKGSDVYFENSGSQLQIYILKELTFYGFENSSMYFSGNFRIVLENIVFYQDETNKRSQAISGADFSDISVISCSFVNLKHMSALVFSNSDTTKIMNVAINASRFINCSSDDSGGALFISGNTTLNIFDSEFEGNSADVNGGAIDYECDVCFLSKFLSQLEIKKNIFQRNKCMKSGGAIKALDLNSISLNNDNKFKENSAQVGRDFSTKPHNIFLSNTSFVFDKSDLVFNFSNSISKFSANISSYLSFNAFLLDRFNNFLFGENIGTLQVSNANLSDSSLNLLFTSQKISNGSALFNVYVVGKTDYVYELNIMYTSGNVQINQKFKIELSSCHPGEYQSNLCQGSADCYRESPSYINSQCITCGVGFYSLNPKKECALCVDHANCLGGNLILPIEGYWRYHENSSKILKCSNLNLCPDQRYFNHANSSKFEFSCGIGSFGNLCSNCDEGFAVSSDKACIKCKADPKVIILAIFNFLVLVYQSLVVFNVKRRQSISRSILKLIVNHTNYVTLLSVFTEMIFSDNLNMVFSLKDSVSTIGTITDSTITDCLISLLVAKEDVVITRVALFSFYPIVIFFLLYLIRISLILLGKLRKNQDSKNDKNFKMIPISCLILVIYSFYPKLVYNAFNLLKCIPLDDSSRNFLEINPNIQCWEKTHFKYLITIFLPNLLVYCLGWPLLLFSMLYRKKISAISKIQKTMNESPLFRNQTLKESEVLKNENDNMRISHRTKSVKMKSEYSLVLTDKQEDDIFQKDKMYAYITIDYASNTYYWDSFFFATNLVLISVSIASNKISTLFYVAIIISIFFAMLLLSQHIQPFRYSEINNLMNYSFIAIIITFFAVANLTFLGDSHQTLQKMYFSIIFISNGLFYFFWFYLLLQTSIIPSIKEILKKLREKVKKPKNKKGCSEEKITGRKKDEIKKSEEKMTQSRNIVESQVKKPENETEGAPKTTEIENLMNTVIETKKDEEKNFEEIDLVKTKLHFKGDIISVYDE